MKIQKQTTVKYVDLDDNQVYQFEPVEDTPILQKTETGYELRYLVVDENPESPDEWDNEEMFLVHYHRQFNVENKRINKDDLVDWVRGNIEPEEKEDHYLNQWWIFPVSALIHGGVWLRLGRTSFEFDPGGWDTSHCGFVFCSKKEWSNENEAYKAAGSLVEEWNQYLSSNVYGVVVEHLDEDKKLIDFDSCWGFYGIEYAKQEINSL